MPLTAYANPGETWQPNFEFSFGGLNTTQDSSQINDSDSPDAQNIITDHGFLEKRPGNLRLTTISSGTPVKAVFEFVTPSNSRYLIAQASATVYQTNLSSTPAILQQLTAGQDIDCVAAFGKLVCADGADPVWQWDGVSTSVVTNAPTCTYLTFSYNRLFCGAPSNDLSQVAVSSFASLTVWSPANQLPLPANSATSFEFNQQDGDSILCMKPTPWGLFVGKHNSSFILKGFDVNTFYINTIDPYVGCIDQRSVQVVNGVLTWMSQKGVYQWPGNGPAKWISQEIDTTYRQIRQLNANSNFWQQSSPVDWQSGVITNDPPSLSWDAVDVPGSIFPSSSVFQDTSTSVGIQFGSTQSVTLNISTGDFNGGVLGTEAISLSSQVAQDNWSNNAVTGHLNWTATSGSWAINSPGSPIANAFSINNQPNSTSGGTIATSQAVFSSGSWNWGFYFGNTNGSSSCADSGQTTECFSVKFMYKDSNNYYDLQYVSQTALKLRKTVSGTTTVLTSSTTNLQQGTTYQFTIERSTDGRMALYVGGIWGASTTADTSILGPTKFQIDDDGCQNCRGVLGLNFTHYYFNFYAFNYQRSGYFQSRIFDTSFSTPTSGVFSSTFSVGTQNTEGQTVFYTRFSTSPNNDMWTTWSASSDTITISSYPIGRYFQYTSTMTTFISTKTPTVNSVVALFISTGIYYSPVHFVGNNITAWKQFAVTDVEQTAGELQYYVRAATYTFTPLATTPFWTSLPINTIPNISTGAYAQFKVDSSSITSSSMTASISRIIWNWQEGTSVRVASGFMDQRYFLCINLSTSNVINDSCFVYMRNNKWSLFNGPSIAALSPFNFRLLGASGNLDSKTWYLMQDNIYDDDGATINAYWKTKHFIQGSPFDTKTYYEIWTDNKYNSGSTMDVGYAVDKNSTFNTKTVNLDGTGTNSAAIGQAVAQRTFPQKGYELFKYIQFQFANNTLDKSFQLNDFTFWTDKNPRRTQ